MQRENHVERVLHREAIEDCKDKEIPTDKEELIREGTVVTTPVANT